MLREIKGMQQWTGPPKEILGLGQNYIWDPYGIIFKQQRLKTGAQYSKVLRIPLNQVLMPYTRPDVDWALLDFRLFLKLDPPSRFGAQGKSPPLPPPLSVALAMNAFIW